MMRISRGSPTSKNAVSIQTDIYARRIVITILADGVCEGRGHRSQKTTTILAEHNQLGSVQRVWHGAEDVGRKSNDAILLRLTPTYNESAASHVPIHFPW
jgi:hypothetical protein